MIFYNTSSTESFKLSIIKRGFEGCTNKSSGIGITF